MTVDQIDALAGIHPGTALDALRRRRPVTREQLQASHDALLAPRDDTTFPLADRLLVAAFATRLTADDETAAAYAVRARAVDPQRASAVSQLAATIATEGPYGDFVEAGLAAESTDGIRYSPTPAVRDAVGDRLAAALAHVHLLTYRPREAHDQALDALLEAGWGADDIVTLSQLVAFLAFQQRVAAGLRVLADTTKEVAA